MTRHAKYPILVFCLMTLVSGVLLKSGNVGAESQYEHTTATPAGYGQTSGYSDYGAATAAPNKEIDYAQILEDTDIMSKIIDKTLEKKWPKKYEPSTLFRQSLGCQGVYLKGYGVVLMTNINFPVAEREKPQEKEAPPGDLWLKTKSELSGARGAPTVVHVDFVEDYDAKRVGTLKEELLNAIGEYGPNIRQLRPQENIVIVVRGAAGNILTSVSGYYPRAPVEIELDKLEGKLEEMEEHFEEQLNHAGEPGNEMTHEVKEPSDVTFKVRNPSGRIVRTISVGHKEPGTVALRWDGKNDAGKEAKAGIYAYEVTAGDDITTGKIILTGAPKLGVGKSLGTDGIEVAASKITVDSKDPDVYVLESKASEPVEVRVWGQTTKPENTSYNAAVQLYQTLNFAQAGGSTTGRTTMIIKVSKKNIDAYKDGSLDFEEFAKKAEITQY
ncbi:FlgD immunoglobulin-like domain containing protein [Candidatus Poribacteria bacterium]